MHQQTIVDLVARQRLPAAYPAREFVEAGGLMAYAVSYPDLYARFASFIDKIFKRRKPGRPAYRAADDVRAGHQLPRPPALGVKIPQPSWFGRMR
jgi:putative ABC transport system substrate-binding protein